MLAELWKPVVEDTWMGQTMDEHVSPSEAPRLMMGWRGEWGARANKGKKVAAISRLQRTALPKNCISKRVFYN